MTTPPRELSPDAALAAAVALADAPVRAIVGIVGAPGAGKSTYARWLVDAVNATGRRAALVPMDGFHLAHAVLIGAGLASVKGAPETFDAAGYLALLQRIRDNIQDVVWAPRFDRDLEDAVAASLPVGPEVSLVVTEGNYLLLAEDPWRAVRRELDTCWYVEVDDDVRRERLQARHERHGRSPEAAAERTWGSDEANARLVVATRERADALVRPA